MSQSQLLPFEIIEHVVKYTLSTYASSYRSDARVGLSLLHSCRSWRKAFIDAAFDSLTLTFSDKDILRIRFSKCCSFLHPLDYPIDCHVKSLDVTFRNWGDVMSGKVGTWMRSSGFAEMPLSRLDAFSFDVHNSPPQRISSDLDVSQAMQEIVSFFQLLRQMMPSMRKVAFENAAVGWHISDKTIDLLIKAQVMDLLRGANSVRIGCYGISTYLQHTDVFTNGNLTVLSYRHRYNLDTTSFLNILRLNAANVVSVDIDYLLLAYVKDIIMRDNGEPLVYPCLSLLRLTSIYRSTTQWPPLSDELADSPPDVNHFPVLKTLDLSGGLYPFKSSVFGNGSNNTLEALLLTIYSFDISQYLFSSLLSTQFVKLKSIALLSFNSRHSQSARVMLNKQQEDDVVGLLQSFFQSAACLTRFSSLIPVSSSLFLADTSCVKVDCLRYLDIEHNILSFSNILQIIRKAHYLKRVTCRLDRNPPNIEGVESSKLAQHIHALHPISSHFVGLRVKSPSRKVVGSHIRTAVLLAIGCPNFSIMDFEDQNCNEIRTLVDSILKTRPYKIYADSGKRLLDRIDNGYTAETVEDKEPFPSFD